MPTRLLKESICTSKDINRLTPEQEVFFYRLIVNCDDFGYLDADPSIIRARTFPRRTDDIYLDNICQWLQALVVGELAVVFEVEGSYYLRLTSWEKHQQVRAKRSKYPVVDEDCRILIADEINCKQLISNDSKCARNPIQSNPDDSHPKPTTKTVDIEFLTSMKTLFPMVDVTLEWEHCQIWCKDNNKKSSRSRFMNWLKKAKGKQPEHKGMDEESWPVR
jgi:hypothetical protein